MKSRTGKILNLSLWLLLILLAVVVGLYPALYFILDRKFSLLAIKQEAVLTNISWNIFFYIHITTSGLALLSGWLQFSGKFRNKYPAIHRNAGKFYMVNALPAAATGIGLAAWATGGPLTRAGFALLGILWLLTTILALKSARNNRILQHRQMALYSYAACFAAVTLRLWLQLFLYLGMDFLAAYRIVAWLCWVPNIIFVFFLERQINIAHPDK